MRKIGLWFIIFGGSLGVILLLVRKSAWYISESASKISEPAEFIESAFYASIITGIVGGFLLLLSLRKKSKSVQMPAQEEAFDDGHGAAMRYNQAAHTTYPDVYAPAEYTEAFVDTVQLPEQELEFWEQQPTLEATRRVPQANAEREGWTCALCGCRNPEYSSICALCGNQYEE